MCQPFKKIFCECGLSCTMMSHSGRTEQSCHHGPHHDARHVDLRSISIRVRSFSLAAFMVERDALCYKSRHEWWVETVSNCKSTCIGSHTKSSAGQDVFCRRDTPLHKYTCRTAYVDAASCDVFKIETGVCLSERSCGMDGAALVRKVVRSCRVFPRLIIRSASS